MLHDAGLVGDLGHLDTDRKLGDDPCHRGLEVFAERDDVRAVLHGDAEAERGLAAFPDDEGRGILVATADRGDVAEPKHPAVRLHRNRRDRLGARERAGNPQIDAIR